MQEILLQIRYLERELSKSFKKINFIFLSNRMSSVYHSYVIRMSLVCHPYVTRMYSYVIRMSLVYHSYVLVCHPYVTCMYSYFIRMSLVCTRISFVCHSSVVLNKFDVFRFLEKWIIIISIHFLFRDIVSTWHMHQRDICVNVAMCQCVNVAHVSNRLKFDTFFYFHTLFWKWYQ